MENEIKEIIIDTPFEPSNSIETTSNNKVFDFCKRAKYFLVSSLAVILAGIIVFSFFGLNLGIDFTGGSVLHVNGGTVLESKKNLNMYEETVQNILKEYGTSIYSAQISGEDDELTLVIKYQNVAGKTTEEMKLINKAIATEIRTALLLAEENVENPEIIGASFNFEYWLKSIFTITIVINLILIYIAFRMDLTVAITTIAILIHDLLALFAIVAISRLTVGTSFIISLLILMLYAAGNAFMLFGKIRENKNKESLSKLTNKELSNLSIKETILRCVYSATAVVGTLIVIALFGGISVARVVLPLVLAVAISTYSSVFLSAPLWALINDNTKPKKPKKLNAQINKTDLY